MDKFQTFFNKNRFRLRNSEHLSEIFYCFFPLGLVLIEVIIQKNERVIFIARRVIFIFFFLFCLFFYIIVGVSCTTKYSKILIINTSYFFVMGVNCTTK